MILERRDDRRAGIDLHMPTQVANLFGSGVEQRLGVGGIETSRGIGLEIEANAANAGVCHFLQSRARGGLVDHRNAARAHTHAAHGVDGASIVRAVDARLHDDDAIEIELALQFEQLLD